MQGVTEGLIRFHGVHKDFEVGVEVCQVGARFETLEFIVTLFLLCIILTSQDRPPERCGVVLRKHPFFTFRQGSLVLSGSH